MGRGSCPGSRRGARGGCPPRPPGVSCPVSASPLGPLGQPGLLGVLGPWGVGPTGGPGGPVPRGWTLVRLHLKPPGPLQAPPPRPLGQPRGRPPGVRGAGRTGHATGTSVPSPGGCGRPLPCVPLGRRRAPRATPGVPASPHLCSTCLEKGGILWAPWPPVLGGAAPTFGCVPRGWWAAIPGGLAFHRCEGSLMSGAVPPWAARPVRRAGFSDPCVPGAVGVGVRTQHLPHSVCSCERSLRAVWVAEGPPRGGPFRRCEGRLSSGASRPPAARPLGGPSGSATHVLWARGCGCGGPALSPWLACPVGSCVPRGWWGAISGRAAFPRSEGCLVSGAVPPPAVLPVGRAAGALRPVCAGCGWCGRGDPALGPQLAHFGAAVARFGGGGRASPGGVPFAVVRGA